MLNYFRKEIWKIRIETLPKWKRLWIILLRILLLTSQGFTKSQIQQGATSLTYYSLLAIVPVIALLIGIARGFYFEQKLENWLLYQFSEQEEIIKRIFSFANTSIEQTHGGIIAGAGTLLFLWASINILMNIEFVMNKIWEVKEGRSIARKFTDYLALIVLAPIIVFLASGLTGFISAALTSLTHGVKVFENIAPILFPLLSTIPFFLTCLLLTFLYIFMPNTRVKVVPALIAGVLTGISYQLVQWVYLYFQIGVAKYNAIYGTFAALPLFLIWLHLSWVIILMGAKIAFAIQNANAYEFISDIHINHKFRTICLLRIAHLCIHNFCKADPPPSILEISNTLSIPLILTGKLIHQLVASKVLVEVKRNDREDAFQPARSVDNLTIKQVIDMIDERGEVIDLPPSHELTVILNSLEKFSAAIQNSDGNILLKDI